MAPDGVALFVEFRHRQRKCRKRPVDLDPFGIGGLGHKAAAGHHLRREQSHCGERAAIDGDAQNYGVEFAREHAQQRVGHAQTEHDACTQRGRLPLRQAQAGLPERLRIKRSQARGKPPADRLRDVDCAMQQKVHSVRPRKHL